MGRSGASFTKYSELHDLVVMALPSDGVTPEEYAVATSSSGRRPHPKGSERTRPHGPLCRTETLFGRYLAEYLYAIRKGRVVYEATAEELWQNEEVKRRYLGVWGLERSYAGR
jgi:hypothetical protein